MHLPEKVMWNASLRLGQGATQANVDPTLKLEVQHFVAYISQNLKKLQGIMLVVFPCSKASTTNENGVKGET